MKTTNTKDNWIEIPHTVRPKVKENAEREKLVYWTQRWNKANKVKGTCCHSF